MRTKSIITSLAGITGLVGILMCIPTDVTPKTISVSHTGVDADEFLSTMQRIEPSLSLQYTINKTTSSDGKTWYHFSPITNVLVRYTTQSMQTTDTRSESLDELILYYVQNQETDQYVQDFLTTLNEGWLQEQFITQEGEITQTLESIQLSLQTDVFEDLRTAEKEEEADSLKQLIQAAQFEETETIRSVIVHCK